MHRTLVRAACCAALVALAGGCGGGLQSPLAHREAAVPDSVHEGVPCYSRVLSLLDRGHGGQVPRVIWFSCLLSKQHGWWYLHRDYVDTTGYLYSPPYWVPVQNCISLRCSDSEEARNRVRRLARALHQELQGGHASAGYSSFAALPAPGLPLASVPADIPLVDILDLYADVCTAVWPVAVEE